MYAPVNAWYTAIMPIVRDIADELNVGANCRKYGLPLWQCPQFLFLVMGGVIIISSIFFFLLGRAYISDPLQVALYILILSTFLLVLAFTITRSVEHLAEANRMKAEFVSIASHQLRAPLSNLSWGIEYLMAGRAGAVSKDQAGYFRLLKENAGRMRELVADLLTVSRIEQNRLPVRREEFLLPDLVAKITAEFEPMVRASNVRLEVEGNEQMPPFVQDPHHLRQIISNFLDNAVRYANPEASNGSAIRVRYGMRGGKGFVEVEDNGVGIPKRDQKHIFQKFFRSDNALRHQTDGSGLGLYIAKSLAEAAGGSVGFRSREGEGSTFWVAIPAHIS